MIREPTLFCSMKVKVDLLSFYKNHQANLPSLSQVCEWVSVYQLYLRNMYKAKQGKILQ